MACSCSARRGLIPIDSIDYVQSSQSLGLLFFMDSMERIFDVPLSLEFGDLTPLGQVGDGDPLEYVLVRVRISLISSSGASIRFSISPTQSSAGTVDDEDRPAKGDSKLFSLFP